MSAEALFEAGTPVRLVSENGLAFAVLDPDDTEGKTFMSVDEALFNSGDVVRYGGLHPIEYMANRDWHMVVGEVDGRTYEAPVHSENVEAIS